MSRISLKKTDFVNLIIYYQKGEISALEELLKRIQKNVYTMFSYLARDSQDVSDMTQEVLIRVAKGLKSLNEPSNFKSWLNHIVTNVFFDFGRKNSAEKNIDHDEDKLLALRDKIGCEPGEKCLFSEIDRIIKIALINLPKNLRIAIILREYEGLSYEDISKITNTTLGTVKSRISRARLKLQNELKDFI